MKGISEPTEPFVQRGPGARLREAREAANITVDKVATSLLLDSATIEALEADAFDQLPAPTFVRGYLRGYARIVGLPSGPILDLYDSRGFEPPPLAMGVSESSQAHTSDIVVRLVTYAVGAALVLLVGLWWHSQESDGFDISIGSDLFDWSSDPVSEPPVVSDADPGEEAFGRPAASMRDDEPLAHLGGQGRAFDEGAAGPAPADGTAPGSATETEISTASTPQPEVVDDVGAPVGEAGLAIESPSAPETRPTADDATGTGDGIIASSEPGTETEADSAVADGLAGTGEPDTETDATAGESGSEAVAAGARTGASDAGADSDDDALAAAGDTTGGADSAASDTFAATGEPTAEADSDAGSALTATGEPAAETDSGAGNALTATGESAVETDSGTGSALTATGESTVETDSGTGSALTATGESAVESGSTPESEPAATAFPAPTSTAGIETPPARSDTASADADPASGAETTESELVLEFVHESWVEIYDRDRTRLFFGLVQPGRMLEFAGAKPFDILLGFSKDVRVTIDGAAFDHTPYIRHGVARFRTGMLPTDEAANSDASAEPDATAEPDAATDTGATAETGAAADPDTAADAGRTEAPGDGTDDDAASGGTSTDSR